MLSFIKFGGQKSKNVNDVRKICLEMALCVLKCFVVFHMFVLDEIDMRDPNLVYKYIWV